MASPELNEFLDLSRSYNLIPVYREVLADLETPISIFLKLCAEDGPAFLLESVEGGERVARYSFLGCRPFLKMEHKAGTTRLVSLDPNTGRATGCTEQQGSPLEHLRDLMGAFRAPELSGLPRFYGGATGYLGFDVVRYIEHLPAAPPDDLSLPDAAFMLTELVVVFDHIRHRALLVACARVPADAEGSSDAAAERAYRQAVALLERAAERLKGPVPTQGGLSDEGGRTLAVSSNTTREEFSARVRRAKEYIGAGDIFQVVLSQRLQADFNARPFDVYRVLRTVNPSPYMFYLTLGDGLCLVGSSPELMVRVEDGVTEIRPIAGTRPRGKDEAEDVRLERELLADAKERAEHVMLVDLGRNDLGRVCRYGTVEVKELMRVERYSHVMHIVSDVRGELREGCDAIDALAACFPAGTLSGAPKVRAMEIIDELETTRRGPYGGAVGYFSFSGNMDSCITIRTVVLTGGKAYVQAGAGVVADSDPDREFEECLHKAGALMRTLQMVEEGQL